MLTLSNATISFLVHHFQPRRVRHVMFVHVGVLKNMLFMVVRPDEFRTREAFDLFLGEKQSMGQIQVQTSDCIFVVLHWGTEIMGAEIGRFRSIDDVTYALRYDALDIVDGTSEGVVFVGVPRL